MNILYLHIRSDMTGNSHKTVFQAFPVHHGCQLCGTVFPHYAYTLDIQAETARNNGNVDPLSAQIHTGIPDPVNLSGLKILNIDRLVKAGIQANGCNHFSTPLHSIRIIIPFRSYIRNRSPVG